MSLPDTPGAYLDCYAVFDRAKKDSHGARVQFSTYSEAKQFQTRMNFARSLQRQVSTTIYKPGDSNYNTSIYDNLQVKSPVSDTEELWWINVEKRGTNILAIESLSEVEARMAEDQLQITYGDDQ